MIPFQQQNNNPYPAYNQQGWYNNGTTYNQQAPNQNQPVLNNFLTPEQMAQIQQNPSFPARLSQTEYYRAICTHKNGNAITIEKLQSGKHRCSICGEEFVLFDLNTDDNTINSICTNMYDLLQSTKTYFLNAPDDLKNFYMVLGFIQKIPQLWNTAKKTFEQASNATAFGLQQNYDQNGFQILGNIFGGNMMPGMFGTSPGYYGQPTMQPQMNQQYQQQQYYQQPIYNNGYPQQQQMMQQPQGQYMPPPPGQMQQPMMQQPQGQYVYQQPQQQQQMNAYNNMPPPPPGYVQTPQQQMAQQPMSGNPIGYVDPSQQQQATVSMQVPLNNTNASVIPQKTQIVEQPTNPNMKAPDPNKTLLNNKK